MNNNSQKNFQNKEFEDALENDSEEKENLEYETEEETIASDNDNQSKIEQEQFRAKMLKLFGIVIIGLIIVLGLGFILSLFSKKEKPNISSIDSFSLNFSFILYIVYMALNPVLGYLFLNSLIKSLW